MTIQPEPTDGGVSKTSSIYIWNGNSKFRLLLMGADNSFYRPALAFLTLTDQNDSRHNVKTVLPIISTLILLEKDQQLLSQS